MAGAIHIGKAAKHAGVSVDTIRFYQKLGLIKSPNRSVGGYRLFDGEQIRELTFVRHAHDLGFSLNVIKELLGLSQKHHASSDVQSMLKRKLTDVRSKIKSLVHLEAELSGSLRNCNRELRLQREVRHEDCCPLLTKLERMNEIVLQDYFDDGSGKVPRYYQSNAINAAIEAIAKGQNQAFPEQ